MGAKRITITLPNPLYYFGLRALWHAAVQRAALRHIAKVNEEIKSELTRDEFNLIYASGVVHLDQSRRAAS